MEPCPLVHAWRCSIGDDDLRAKAPEVVRVAATRGGCPRVLRTDIKFNYKMASCVLDAYPSRTPSPFTLQKHFIDLDTEVGMSGVKDKEEAQAIWALRQAHLLRLIMMRVRLT